MHVPFCETDHLSRFMNRQGLKLEPILLPRLTLFQKDILVDSDNMYYLQNALSFISNLFSVQASSTDRSQTSREIEPRQVSSSKTKVMRSDIDQVKETRTQTLDLSEERAETRTLQSKLDSALEKLEAAYAEIAALKDIISKLNEKLSSLTFK